MHARVAVWLKKAKAKAYKAVSCLVGLQRSRVPRLAEKSQKGNPPKIYWIVLVSWKVSRKYFSLSTVQHEIPLEMLAQYLPAKIAESGGRGQLPMVRMPRYHRPVAVRVAMCFETMRSRA